MHTTQCNIVFKHFLTFASLNNLSKSNLIHIVLDISIFHFHFFFHSLFIFHLSLLCLPVSRSPLFGRRMSCAHPADRFPPLPGLPCRSPSRRLSLLPFLVLSFSSVLFPDRSWSAFEATWRYCSLLLEQKQATERRRKREAAARVGRTAKDTPCRQSNIAARVDRCS